MRHLMYRFATVALLVLPLAFGTTDAYSAKKKVSDRSDAISTSKGTAESSKTQKSPTTEPVNRDPKTNIAPNATATPSRPVQAPTRASSDITAPSESPSPAGAAAIENNWISINHGGATEVSAGNLRLGISIAQPVAGYVEAGNYQLGLGYWYGAAAGGGTGACDCPWQADFNEDGVRDNIDLNVIIDILFFNGSNLQDPDCPAVRADFNCDGTPDNLDLNWMIDHLFFNGVLPCEPCNCASYPSDCPAFP